MKITAPSPTWPSTNSSLAAGFRARFQGNYGRREPERRKVHTKTRLQQAFRSPPSSSPAFCNPASPAFHLLTASARSPAGSVAFLTVPGASRRSRAKFLVPAFQLPAFEAAPAPWIPGAGLGFHLPLLPYPPLTGTRFASSLSEPGTFIIARLANFVKRFHKILSSQNIANRDAPCPLAIPPGIK